MTERSEDNVDRETADAPVGERFVTAADGLRLHVRVYGDAASPWTPVICLPGLSRTHRDYDALARHLANHRHRPRRVLCPDYRGRGRSAWDPDPQNYNPFTEMRDVHAVMAALDVPRAIFVGTSRGGIVSMFVGVDRPTCMAALVLVDIGPVIEPLGLARIKSYVGRTPPPIDWADAAAILRRLHAARFTAWDDADWDRQARLTFRDEDGRPVSDYDPRLSETLDGVDFDQPLPDMWQEFRALTNLPVLAIRGEHSDILSADTLDEMAAVHPELTMLTVPGEGHPPHLAGGPLLNRMSSFITGIEGATPPRPPMGEVKGPAASAN